MWGNTNANAVVLLEFVNLIILVLIDSYLITLYLLQSLVSCEPVSCEPVSCAQPQKESGTGHYSEPYTYFALMIISIGGND